MDTNTPLYGYYSEIQSIRAKKLFIYKQKKDETCTIACTQVSSDNPTTFLKNTKLNDMTYIGEAGAFVEVKLLKNEFKKP